MLLLMQLIIACLVAEEVRIIEGRVNTELT